MGTSCAEMGCGKPLFLAIYATVLLGIVFSALFIFASLYGSAPSASTGSWLSPVIRSTAAPPRGGDVSVVVGGSDVPAPIETRSPPRPLMRTPTPVPPSRKRNVWTKDIWEIPPEGEAMPPVKTFRLTKEMVKHRAKDNVIIVTFGNYAFMDFILTWVRHLTDMDISNLLVGAMDTKLLEALYRKGIPVFDMGSKMDTDDVGWGSPTFHRMGREKVFLINAILPMGFELLMCDTDMVWMKNPLPYLARFPEADVLTSTDQVVPTSTDDNLDVWHEVSGAYNIGIFHWRPTAPAIKLAKEWKKLLLSDDKIWDQNGFNDLVKKKLGPPVDGDDGLFYAYDGNLKLGLLPASIFCSGHTYFVQRMHQQFDLDPYAVHTTFQYAGTEGKRHRLREAKLFYDPPEYYDSPGGFLTFKPRIPKSLLLDGAHSVETHFLLVNHQIVQIRTALAVASLLNRTLVMPPLWCRLDRMWFGHPGILPGSVTRQPFLCPMDHVFEVNNMLKDISYEEFGPRIDFREYSFLENPLFPKQVKESWLEVHLCEENSASCNDSKPGVLRFPKNSDEEMFIKVFSAYKDVKVLDFSSINGVFRGFSDKEKELKFRRRVKRYTGIWCCVEQREIGHVYYDMYWDEKPGWKPTPPETRADDHPPID